MQKSKGDYLMKKSGITFVFVLIIVLAVVVAFSGKTTTYAEYLRIHIRANSNNSNDQEVKYEVKDKIVEVLTPLLCEVKTKEQAIDVVEKNINLLTKTADDVLKENGFLYSCRVGIRSEYFPTRSYENLTLSSDVYDAIIVELGSGVGDNWWCVVYPPMCFVSYEGYDTSKIEYKSKLLEIIKNFLNDK